MSKGLWRLLAAATMAWAGCTHARADLSWGPPVIGAEERVYSVEYVSDHLGVDEFGDPYLIGYTRTTHDVVDIIFQAPWNPETPGENSWRLHTTEGNWSISVSLQQPPWRVEQFGLGPVTFYGFDLGLDNGSWSYTFKRLGGFQDGKLYPTEFHTDNQLGPGYESSAGERAVQITNPWLGIPYEVIAPINGGEVDTGWSYWWQLFGGNVQLDDMPVEDEYWFFSLEPYFQEDLITVRLGLGLETSRETVFYPVPEPGSAVLLTTGLALLYLWRRKSRGG